MASGRLYANYTHGDCCTLDAWDSAPDPIWTDSCEVTGGYCTAGNDVANWMFQIPQLPEGAELLEVRLKLYRQSGWAGSGTVYLRGSWSGSLGTSAALETMGSPSHTQSTYFSSTSLQSIVLPTTVFLDPDLDPYLAVAIYRSSYLGILNNGTYGPTLEFTYEVDVVPPCEVDFNDDDTVDGSDLAFLIGHWGLEDATYDLDGNGVIDGADLTILLAHWGACPK